MLLSCPAIAQSIDAIRDIQSPIATIARFTIKIVSVIALLALAIALTSFAVNCRDAPLNAEAKALLELPADPYLPGDNIYDSMAGFNAPTAQSVVTAGEARISEYNLAFDWKLAHPTDPAAYITNPDPNELKFGGTSDFCRSPPSSVWAETRNHRPDIAALLSANQELYQRYLGLHRLRGYHETARPSYLPPFFVVSQPVRCLFLADFANRFQTGSLQQQRAAIDDLSQDLRIWMAMLRGDGTLLSKMIAAASLHRDLMVLAELVTDPSSDMMLFEGEQAGVLTPFPTTDWNIGNAFGAEFRAMVPLFIQMTSKTWAMSGTDEARATWWQRLGLAFQMHFFKYNATENLSAGQMVQLTKLALSDPHGFSIAKEAYRAWLRENETPHSPSVLFNPVGKILVSIAAPAYPDYLLRTYDVAAFQRLVYLVYQIRRQGIELSEIPKFIKQHPEWSTHPVDGTPFRWNPQSGELVVDPFGTNPVGWRFSVAVFRRPASS
jgi:hypothetical protein